MADIICGVIRANGKELLVALICTILKIDLNHIQKWFTLYKTKGNSVSFGECCVYRINIPPPFNVWYSL